jgi:ArsR family transcriptional regulator
LDASKQFKALANRNRLAIFEYLRQQGQIVVSGEEPVGCDVGQIAEQFELALSTVSHHLRVLHEADLIQCAQHGKYTYCVINTEMVSQLRDFLSTDNTQHGQTGADRQGE